MGELPLISVAAFRQLAELSGDGLCLVDPADRTLEFANPVVLNWAGRSPGSDPHQPIRLDDLMPEIGSQQLRTQLEQLADGAIDEATFTGHVHTAGGKLL